MKNIPCKSMEAAVKIFKKYAAKNKTERKTAFLLTEHYPMLVRCARQSAEECRKIPKKLEAPEFFSGLFDKCSELCKDGTLPDSDVVIEFFKGELNGIETEFLPLAITAALINKCAEAVNDDNVETLEKTVLSIQKMRDTDFDRISEKLFSAEEILMSDPAGVYPHMNSETKKRYRRKIAIFALKNAKTEEETASEILEKARLKGEHIGRFIFTVEKRRKHGEIYLIMEALIPVLVCISSAILSGEWIISLLLYFPIWEILRYPIERASIKGAVPKKFPCLDLNSKAVSEIQALITLSVILPAADKMSELKDKLEDLYLSNAYGNIKVCCLADFRAADMPRKPEDKHILSALNKAIDDLNQKYDGGFIAAVRPRSYSETQNEFIGKERKRGAIRELIRAIKGNEKGFLSIKGDTEKLKDIKYLMVLDYDSRPVFDSLRELVSVAEHPLNKPVIKDGKVISGYGVFAPETVNSLSSSEETVFGSVMSQNSGVSYYDNQSVERYQMLFGESIFCGKGLINVDAYYELLDQKLPKEKILSHDVIEGEFLRTGFVHEVKIIEDFPATADVYYKRLHRWVRGDWQNSGFIFGKNPFDFVSRFKLFDNLRRSLVSAICVAVIVYSAFYQGYAGVTAAVISVFALCASEVFSGINFVIHGGFRSVTGLYYSKKLPEGLACFVRAFFRVSYSARDALFSLDAVIRALWRMLVSGDNLLEWTSSSSEQSDEKSMVYACIPSILTATALFVLGLPIHRMIGILILGDIPLTLFGSSPVKQKNMKITPDQREYLLSAASAMWGYFEDLCGEENNYLPPDNIQFAPHRAIAKRTSPTNIGLMLACFLSARDLGFITTEEMCRRINLSLSSVEKLEKYKGNLMNWYSTESLKTLPPRFVSSVDSGNFLCCLTAVKEGIREYSGECAEIEKTADRIEKIIASTDLSVMYNNRRRLFCIGINPDNGEKSESCYDLYMSEMRMTAYFSVARKLVPKNHWMSLDRPIVKSGRYSGLVSWTGTMFEYFMADIFVPAPHGSLSEEALCFCLQSQRKKAGRNPFGMSESAFYAFDGELNYQYKAHGVQKLGLRRNLDRENVVSPYSTFLTLNIAPRLSLKNLRRLEKLGMMGKYGFYEAVDFSSDRKYGGFSLVNSFMVHHIGMSLLSVDNLLNEKCIQKRFMNDKYMNGAKTLLAEKPLSGKEIFKDVVSDTVIPTFRERVQKKKNEWVRIDTDSERYSVFSNGRMTLFANNEGQMTVTMDGERAWSSCFFGEFICETNDYNFCNPDSYIRQSNMTAEYRSDYDGLRLTVQVFMLKTDNCIITKYTIENKKTGEAVKGKLRVQDIKDFNDCFVSCGFINSETNRNGNCFETDAEIMSGETKEFVFVTATETTESEALNSFEAMKTKKNHFSKAENPFCVDSFLQALSEKYLPHLINYDNKKVSDSEKKFGISGNYPMIFVKAENKSNLETVRLFIVFNKILRNCGIKNTLIICNNAPKNEKTSVLQTIETFLNEERCDLMLGIGGGIYIKNEDFLKNSAKELNEMKNMIITE